MRLSADSDDPGYQAYINLGERKRDVRVLLDGMELKSVLTADTQLGIAVVCELDDQGKAQLDKSSGELKRKTLHGKVAILFEGERIL